MDKELEQTEDYAYELEEYNNDPNEIDWNNPYWQGYKDGLTDGQKRRWWFKNE